MRNVPAHTCAVCLTQDAWCYYAPVIDPEHSRALLSAGQADWLWLEGLLPVDSRSWGQECGLLSIWPDVCPGHGSAWCCWTHAQSLNCSYGLLPARWDTDHVRKHTGTKYVKPNKYEYTTKCVFNADQNSTYLYEMKHVRMCKRLCYSTFYRSTCLLQ